MKNDRTNVGETKANQYQAGTTCAWVYQKIRGMPRNRFVPIERLLNKYGDGIYLRNVQSTFRKVCKDHRWEHESMIINQEGRLYVKIIQQPLA